MSDMPFTSRCASPMRMVDAHEHATDRTIPAKNSPLETSGWNSRTLIYAFSSSGDVLDLLVKR